MRARGLTGRTTPEHDRAVRRILCLLFTPPMLMLACTTGGTEIQTGPAGSGSSQAPIAVTQVDLGAPGTEIADPHVVIDGEGAVHLIWWDNTVVDGIVRHAIVEGISIGDPEAISDVMDVFTTETSVLVNPSGEVCAFFDGWLDEQDLSTRGFYVRCLSSGTWSAPDLVTSHGVTSTFDPAFEADGTPRAVATTPIDSVTFEGTELSDLEAGGVIQAQLEIDPSGTYHVAWEELLATSNEMVHRSSDDGGATWSPIDTFDVELLFATPELIAGSDGSVHLLYQQDTAVMDRVWNPAGGWEDPIVGPECGGPAAFALGPGDVPVAACANLEGVALTSEIEGSWSILDPVPGSTDAPATAVAISVGADDVRHVVWVTGEATPALRYAAVPR